MSSSLPWWEGLPGFEDAGEDTGGEEILERWQRHVEALAAERSAKRKSGLDFPQLIQSYLAEAARTEEDALTTGWPTVDGELGRPILPGEVVIIGARTGVGKALWDEEPVLTPNGWVPICMLGAGDEAMSADGSVQLVEGVHPQGDRETFRFEFSDGAIVHCDEDHLWVARWRGAWKTYTASELFDSGAVSPSGRLKWEIPKTEPLLFPERSLSVDPYLMGALLGDGCLYGGASITTADGWMAAECRRRVAAPLAFWGKDKRSRAMTFNFRKDTGVPQALRELGLRDVGSHQKFIPKSYLYGSMGQRKLLLAGLLDSDGEASGGRIGYSSTSWALASGVQELALSLGGTCRMKSGRGSYKNRGGERVWGKMGYALNISLPFNPFRMPRKRKALNQQRAPKPRMIRSITPAGRKPCTCISVSGEDGLYLTRDYVVTHNTWVVQHLGEKAVENPNHRVAFISMEMSYWQVGERFAAHALDENPSDVTTAAREGKLTVEQIVEATPGADRWWFYERSIAVEDLPDVVASAAEDLGAPPSIVILDYLGLLSGKGTMYERTSANARALKDAAKETNTIILCCSQISRQSGGSGEEEPSLAGMRDSGAIEEAADRAFLFWQVKDSSDEIVCRLAKNRHGQRGSAVRLIFDKALRLREQSQADTYRLTHGMDDVPF